MTPTVASVTYVATGSFTGATVAYSDGLLFDIATALTAGGGSFTVNDQGLIEALDRSPAVHRSGTVVPPPIPLQQAGFVTVTSNYGVQPGDKYIFVDATAGTLSIALPDARVNQGRRIDVAAINTNANLVTLASAVSGQTVMGSASLQIGQNQTFTGLALLSDGANWQVVSTIAAQAVALAAHVAATGAHGFPDSGRLLRTQLQVADVQIAQNASVDAATGQQRRVGHRGQITGNLYGASVGAYVYVSRDGGATWSNYQPISNGVTAGSQMVRLFETSGVGGGGLGTPALLLVAFVVATNQYSLWRTTDLTNLTAWTKVMDFPTPGRWSGDISRMATSQSWCQTQDGTLYLGEYNDSNGFVGTGQTVAGNTINLWKSTNDGATWTSAHLWDNNAPDALGPVRHIHCVRPDPFVANRVAVTIGDTGVQPRIGYSDDHAATFTWITNGQYPTSRSVGLLFTPWHYYWGDDTPDVPSQFNVVDRVSAAAGANSPNITSLATCPGVSLESSVMSNGAIAWMNDIEPAINYGKDDYFHFWTCADGKNLISANRWKRTQADQTTKVVGMYHITDPDSNVQTVNLGGATSGSAQWQFTVRFPETGPVTFTSAAIAFNATAAQIQAALLAATTPTTYQGQAIAVPQASITVTGGPLPGTVTVTFGLGLAGQEIPQITLTGSTYAGGSTTITTTNKGGFWWGTIENLAGVENIGGGLSSPTSLTTVKCRVTFRDAADTPHMNMREQWEGGARETSPVCDVLDATTGTSLVTATVSELGWDAPYDCAILAGWFHHDRSSDLVSDPSNYWTIFVKNYRAASVLSTILQCGGANVAMAHSTPIQMSAANSPPTPIMAAGDSARITCQKTGSVGTLTRPKVTLLVKRLNNILS